MDMSRLETQQISIRMPKYLVQAIDNERQGYQVSRSQAIIGALQKLYSEDDIYEVSDEYDRNYPYTDASKTVLLASFQEAMEQIKQIEAGEAEATGTLEELIAELEEMDRADGTSNH
ncbi:MAG: hypothetical protein Ctma_1053 [Catillopecten margaritatus gill symbiont]|uniref:CopG family transcriptional regulator n=1 Tax=Catillopecten margaritatus gill symbiont TaxID=3083288 RepID=A0AAU6PHV7_9GAMM